MTRLLVHVEGHTERTFVNEEFEALLFSDCAKFSEAIGQPSAA